MRLPLVATLLALVSPSMASPATAGILRPTTQWTVDYGDTQCNAARSFGSGSDSIALGIIPSFGGDTYKLVISAPRPGPKYTEEMHGTVDFGRGKIKTWLLHYGGGDMKLSNYQLRVSAAEIEQARSASTVSLHSDNGDDFEFALSEMPEVLDALHKCTADLRQYWMGGPHPVSSLSKPAKGDIHSFFSGQDYPAEALRRGQGGTVQYQLLIDATGRVVGCDLIRESGAPILDAMGCQVIMKKGKFSPAIDGNGKPVRDIVVTPPIQWSLAGRHR